MKRKIACVREREKESKSKRVCEIESGSGMARACVRVCVCERKRERAAKVLKKAFALKAPRKLVSPFFLSTPISFLSVKAE